MIRIVQEALWNACKHSDSRSAQLLGRYGTDPGRIRVEVSHSGTGAPPEILEQGQGVATMRDRAARLDGRLEILPNSRTRDDRSLGADKPCRA